MNRKFPFLAYSPPYGPNCKKDMGTFRLMDQAGIRIFKLILCNTWSRLGFPYSPYPPIWKGEYEYDFSIADRQIRDILEQAPDAQFICTVDLNTPKHWNFPAEKDSFQNLSEVSLDPEWIRRTEAWMAALVRHLQDHWQDRIFGWYLACGKTQEWFDLHLWEPRPRKSAEYRRRCEAAGVECLPVPEDLKTYAGPFGTDARPASLRWKEFTNELVAETATRFLKQLRSLIGKEEPVFCVFGNIHTGSPGHLCAEKTWKAAPFDVYIGPSCNTVMQMGGASGFQGSRLMMERYHVHYLLSCDRVLSGSSSEPAPGIPLPASGITSRQHTPEEDIACLRREFGLALVSGFSLWFFNIWAFAYRMPHVANLLPDFRRLWDQYAGQGTPFADTLLVYDPESWNLRTEQSRTPGDQLRRELLPQAHAAFTSGAFSDLAHFDLSPYKVILFPYLPYVTPEKRRFLEEKVLKNNRTVIFFDVPGIFDGEKESESLTESLTGMPFDRQGTGVVQKTDCRIVLFRTPEECTPERLHGFLKEAGCFFWAEEPDTVVWGSDCLLLLHTKNGGPKTIRLPRKVSRVTELYSGEVAAENTACFTVQTAAPDTRLFLLAH